MVKKKKEAKSIYKTAEEKGFQAVVMIGLDDRGVIEVLTDLDNVATVTHLLNRGSYTMLNLEEQAIARGIAEAEGTVEG